MRKLPMILLTILLLTVLIGCEPYTTTTNTTFNLDPISKVELIVSRVGDHVEFIVAKDRNIVEADECILRNDNTHELYPNIGDYENIIYELVEDGYYRFGFHKDDIEVIYSFRLSELKESQTFIY